MEWSPCGLVQFTYELNWDKDKMVLKNLGFDSSSTNLAQNLTFNFQPLKSWFIKLHGEHYRNQIADHQHKILLLPMHPPVMASEMVWS